jgi:hypothetical protein
MAPGLYICLSVDHHTNKKLVEAGKDGQLLFIRGLCHSKQHMADGFVPQHVIPILGWDMNAKEVAEELVRVKAWKKVPGGYAVPIEKWALWQQTKEEIERKRESGREAASRRWHRGSHGSPNGSPIKSGMVNPIQETETETETENIQRTLLHEVPNEPAVGGSERPAKAKAPTADPLAGRERLSKIYEATCRAISECHPRAKMPEPNSKPWHLWRNALRLIVDSDGIPEAELEAIMRWLWKDPGADAAFWRDQVQAIPPLRHAKAGDQSKFLKIAAKWRTVSGGSRKPAKSFATVPTEVSEHPWRSILSGATGGDIPPEWVASFRQLQSKGVQTMTLEHMASSVTCFPVVLRRAIEHPEDLTPAILQALTGFDQGNWWPGEQTAKEAIHAEASA